MEATTFWTAVGSLATVLGVWISYQIYRDSKKSDSRQQFKDQGQYPFNQESKKPKVEQPTHGAAGISVTTAETASRGECIGWITPSKEASVLKMLTEACAQAGLKNASADASGGRNLTGVYLRKPGTLMLKFFVEKRPAIEVDFKKPLVSRLGVKGDIGPAGEGNERLHDSQYSATKTPPQRVYRF